jgi:archaellum component FlaC
MAVMRQSWTDERLDEFGKRIDERFDHVDDRFEEVDRRFREVNHRLDGIDARLATELPRLDQRLDDLHRVMLQGFLVLVGIQVTFFVSTIGFIAVQG